jgi:hypothetical protein
VFAQCTRRALCGLSIITLCTGCGISTTTSVVGSPSSAASNRVNSTIAAPEREPSASAADAPTSVTDPERVATRDEFPRVEITTGAHALDDTVVSSDDRGVCLSVAGLTNSCEPDTHSMTVFAQIVDDGGASGSQRFVAWASDEFRAVDVVGADGSTFCSAPGRVVEGSGGIAVFSCTGPYDAGRTVQSVSIDFDDVDGSTWRLAVDPAAG